MRADFTTGSDASVASMSAGSQEFLPDDSHRPPLRAAWTDVTAPRRLLVASYYYPPCPGIAGVRWATMTHYLRELGYEVTVLASNLWGALPDDEAGARDEGPGPADAARRPPPASTRSDLPVPGYVPERQPPALLTT